MLLLPLSSLLFWHSPGLEGAQTHSTGQENFYKSGATQADPVDAVYEGLRPASWGNYMFLQDVASDAIFLPTRGRDWDDGGTWRDLQEHTWQPFLGFVNRAWVEAYNGIALANIAIDSLEVNGSGSALTPTFIAEVRVLRALYYWWLLDLFRNVPLVTDPNPDPNLPPAQVSPQVLFNFIVDETIAALPDLEVSFAAENYGRVTQGAAHALLATVSLNAEVYTGTAKWNETLGASDAVINSGLYDLMTTFTEVFALENEGPLNPENILVVVHSPNSDFGFLRHMATLHYNQLPENPWNGFSVLADFYNNFDPTDARRDQILVGQQYVLGGTNVGDLAFDRLGDSLIFTVDSPLIGATEGNGPRILKWPVDPNRNEFNAGNDYAIFRYAHILLVKAEALFMLGSTAEALALVNQVRERAFEPDQPLTSLTLDDILAERGYEFLWEGYRRQDLIRTGHFLEAWTLKNTSDGPHREVFPIPQIQLDANPNLVQNAGYGTVGVTLTDRQGILPGVYAFRQNYPNPFNPATRIEFDLPDQVHVSLTVYDITGREVITLVNQSMPSGYHRLVWDSRDAKGQQVPSGIYITRLITPEFSHSIKMVLLR